MIAALISILALSGNPITVADVSALVVAVYADRYHDWIKVKNPDATAARRIIDREFSATAAAEPLSQSLSSGWPAGGMNRAPALHDLCEFRVREATQK